MYSSVIGKFLKKQLKVSLKRRVSKGRSIRKISDDPTAELKDRNQRFALLSFALCLSKREMLNYINKTAGRTIGRNQRMSYRMNCRVASIVYPADRFHQMEFHPPVQFPRGQSSVML